MKTGQIVMLLASYLAVGGLAFYAGKSAQRPSPVHAARSVTTPAPAVVNSIQTPSTPSLDPAPAPIEKQPLDASLKAVSAKPEFAPMFKRNVNIQVWHAKLEKQPRDPVWAAETERAYRDFLLTNPNFARYAINPEVDCRTSMCELRFIAYGGEKSTEWDQLIEKPSSNSYLRPAKAFAGIVDWNEDNGATAVYFMMMFRNRPDPNKDFSRGFSELPQ